MISPRPMSAVFIIRDKKVLLVHNIKHGLRIEPPGGKVESGESFEDAAIREAKEELGIDIVIDSEFGRYEIDTPEGQFEVMMFLCTTFAGLPRSLEPEKISDCVWYSYDELMAIKDQLVPDVIDALPALKKYLS